MGVKTRVKTEVHGLRIRGCFPLEATKTCSSQNPKGYSQNQEQYSGAVVRERSRNRPHTDDSKCKNESKKDKPCTRPFANEMQIKTAECPTEYAKNANFTIFNVGKTITPRTNLHYETEELIPTKILHKSTNIT